MTRILSTRLRLAALLAACCLLCGEAFAVTPAVPAQNNSKDPKTAAKKPAPKTAAKAPVKAKVVVAKKRPLPAKPALAKPLVKSVALVAGTPAANKAMSRSAAAKNGWVQTWDEPTYKDSTSADKTEGEDPVVRKAAVEALGAFNGAVVVADATTGRVLTMVNQPLALGGGYQPCSTIKVPVAFAALHENLVQRTMPAKFYSRRSLDLTDALAYSNNFYFANLGIKLGYERVNYYARLFGLGEKAGLNIEGEHPGYFPPAPPRNGGMGMLTSFGEEISQTPLELAAIMGAISNGGTLYWMQYPRTQDDVKNFQPQVKRHLDIAQYIDTVKPGMRGAVDFGTAKRASQDQVILGKTGTCSEGRTHLGWFGSFIDSGNRRLVVVVLLTGGRPSIGPTASGVAGDVYRRLAEAGYLKQQITMTPAAIMPTLPEQE